MEKKEIQNQIIFSITFVKYEKKKSKIFNWQKKTSQRENNNKNVKFKFEMDTHLTFYVIHNKLL